MRVSPVLELLPIGRIHVSLMCIESGCAPADLANSRQIRVTRCKFAACNAKPVAASARRIAAFERLLDMMDVVLQQFDMGAGSNDAYAQRSEPMFGSVEVADFKALDSDVALVLDRKDGVSS